MTTKATQKDGLGFMMVFGSLAWMPFYFSLSVFIQETFMTTKATQKDGLHDGVWQSGVDAFLLQCLAVWRGCLSTSVCLCLFRRRS